MQLEHSLSSTLTQLQLVLSKLSDEEYSRPLEILSNASIGQHTRHIIEFLQVLINDHTSGIINYDRRNRNKLLEAQRNFAQLELTVIMENICQEDKEVLLTGRYAPDAPEFTVKSSYYREIVYNLEHAIHHMAIIKIAIRQFTNLTLPDDFGVAPATIQHRKSVL